MNNVNTLVRGCTTLLVSVSVNSTVGNALRTLNNPVNKWQRVKVGVGSFVVSSMIADAAETYAGRKYDQYKDSVSKWDFDFNFNAKKKDEKAPDEDEIVLTEEEQRQEG